MWSHLARTLAGQAALKAVPKPKRMSPQARPAPAAVPVPPARSNRQGPWPSGPRAIPFGQIGPLSSNAGRFNPRVATPPRTAGPSPYMQSTGSALTQSSTPKRSMSGSMQTGATSGPWSNYQGRTQGESGDYARVPGFTA